MSRECDSCLDKIRPGRSVYRQIEGCSRRLCLVCARRLVRGDRRRILDAIGEADRIREAA